MGITDADGNLIAKYSYDEWGKLLSIETAEQDNAEQVAVAELNPLRYRGYYYDNETGLYYLQSRYYDPELCRFISADDFGFIEDFSCFGINAYIYCNNDPIIDCDPSGNKSVDKKTKNKMIDRYKDLMKEQGYSYVYNNSEHDNYKVTMDSNGIISLTGEHRHNSGKKYYNSVYIYGKTKAWDNDYQDLRREYETSKGLFDAILELAAIPIPYLSFIMIITAALVMAIREVVTQDEVNKAKARYNKSKKKGYYEFIETLSKTTFNKGKATTTYLISH